MTFPNIFRAALSAVRLAYWKLRGWRTLVYPHEQGRRLAACEACIHLDKESRQCKLCTCFVDWKTWLATEACPDTRWNRQRRKKRK